MNNGPQIKMNWVFTAPGRYTLAVRVSNSIKVLPAENELDLQDLLTLFKRTKPTRAPSLSLEAKPSSLSYEFKLILKNHPEAEHNLTIISPYFTQAIVESDEWGFDLAFDREQLNSASVRSDKFKIIPVSFWESF